MDLSSKQLKAIFMLQVVKESIYDAFYRLTNAKSQITAYVFDVVRAIVPKSDLDDVFLTKEEVRIESGLSCSYSLPSRTKILQLAPYPS